jgi:hypothetical protein
MIYAVENGLTSIVAAADTLVEFENFLKNVDTLSMEGTNLFVNANLASFMEMLSDEQFQNFKRAPIIIEYSDKTSQNEFNSKFNIEVLKLNALVWKQKTMLHDALAEDRAIEDSRPIEKIYGLDVYDPWDKRSDEEKEKDALLAERMKEAQKNGDISGDSFGPKKKGLGNPDDPKTYVTDVRGHIDNEGNTILGDVIAVKGLYDRTDEEQEQRNLPHEDNNHTMANSNPNEVRTIVPDSVVDELDNDDLSIAPDGIIAKFYKVEVIGKKLADVRPILEAKEIIIGETTIIARNNSIGCWFTFLRQMQAEEAHAVMIDAGFDAEMYVVNKEGERLVPKGTKVVDELALEEQNPRPWNFRAKELAKMTSAEKKANHKTLSPKEFIFVGNYEGAVHGTVIFITPKIYFKEKNRMWGRQLGIGHILPRDFTEVSPGIYRSHSRDWNNISYDLASRGFQENLMLQIHINNLNI